jgi:hypothetical protein
MARKSDGENGEEAGSACADCGGGPVIILLGGTPLCDRCHDARVSEETGWPRLPEPPPPETIAGPDGRRHRITYRVWRSPGGVAVEAIEGDRSSEGYFAQVVGPHDADVGALVARTKAAIRRRIMRQDLERSPSGNMIMAGSELVGRLVWQDEGMPYGVVVDGRVMSWEEFGLAMEPYEGWEFRLSFDEDTVDEDGVDEPEPGRQGSASAMAIDPVTDEHIH